MHKSFKYDKEMDVKSVLDGRPLIPASPSHKRGCLQFLMLQYALQWRQCTAGEKLSGMALSVVFPAEGHTSNDRAQHELIGGEKKKHSPALRDLDEKNK